MESQSSNPKPKGKGKAKKAREPFVITWDFTIPKKEVNRMELCERLDAWCRAWCFQLEKGEETGYLHYQGRLKCKDRSYRTAVSKWLPEAHLSPTSKVNINNMFYVMKEATRVKGPWTDADIKVPDWLKADVQWYPWQKDILQFLDQEPDRRIVNVIMEKPGNVGATTLCMWLAVRGLARRIPMLETAKDMSRMIMDCDKSRAYFIDIPKAADKKCMKAFISAIEELKNGYAYDDRNRFKEEYFAPPHVWIFTNDVIDESFLSADRWVKWTITPKMELKKIIPKTVEVKCEHGELISDKTCRDCFPDRFPCPHDKYLKHEYCGLCKAGKRESPSSSNKGKGKEPSSKKQ